MNGMDEKASSWSRAAGARAIGSLDRAVRVAVALRDNPAATTGELLALIGGGTAQSRAMLQQLRALACPGCVRKGRGPLCDRCHALAHGTK